MARDVNLKLADAATPISTTTALTAIDTEGGAYCDVRLFLGTITDVDETMSLTVECSIDNGSSYFHIGEFPGLTATDDLIEIARTVYVPRPTNALHKTKVRLKARAVAGTTPSFPITAFLEPLVSLAPAANDEASARGVAHLT